MGRGVRQELVGRADELAALAATVERGRTGHGAVVVVEGEAGIGKTRLLTEARDRARELGFTCLWGAAHELEQGRPFGAFRDALASPHVDDDTNSDADGAGLLDTIDRAVASPDARFLAQEAIVEHVEGAAQSAPVLLVLDDLHWSDRATLATVWSLARRVGPIPLVVVVAARPVPRSADLDRLLADCRDAGATGLRLRSLSSDDVEALAANVVGAAPGPSLVEWLAGTGGNPFFVIEMLDALAEEGAIETGDDGAEVRTRGLPPELRAALLRRVGAIGTDAEQVLGIAAVLGGPFALDDVGLVLGRATPEYADVVTAAVQAGILEDRGTVLAFRHDLIREALYEHLPEAVRTGLHREVARTLAERLTPSVCARHLVLGATTGDGETVGMLERTATELGPREPEAAAALLERALELTTDQDVRARLTAEHVRALLGAGRTHDAAARARAALDVPGLPSTTEAALQLTLGEVSSHQGSIGAALAHFGRAVEIGALDAGDEAHALGRIAENRAWSFDLPTSWAETENALAVARRVGSTPVATEALATQAALRCFAARFADGIELGRSAVAAAGDDPEALRCTPHAYLGLALLGAGAHDEARRVAEEGRRRAAALGQMLGLQNFEQLLVRLAWFTGRWDDAIAEAEAAATLATDFGLTFGVPANDAILGLIAFHRGDLETPRARQAQGRAGREERGDAAGSELTVLLDALLGEADGDVEGAASLMVDLHELMAALGMAATQLWVGPQAVRLALAAARPDAAARMAEHVAGIERVAGTPTARGAAAASRGLVDGDADMLLVSADAYGEAGHPLDRMLACEWAGAALAAADRTEEGVAALQTAGELAQTLGAVRDERRIHAALRALGVRVGARGERRRAALGWDALTDAELEVARLVGERLRNAEIADQLFVSRRTVETHVSRCYAKLEVSSRADLVRAAREHFVGS